MPQQTRETFLFSLLKIFGSSALSTSEKIQQLLDYGRSFYNVDYAIVSRRDREDYVVQHLSKDDPEGELSEIVALTDTLCQFVYRDRKAKSFQSVSREISERPPGGGGFEFESYIGAPILVDDQVIGTLCFESFAARPTPFEQEDLDLVETLADWIGSQFEYDQLNREHCVSITESPSFFLHVLPDGTIAKINRSLALLLGRSEQEAVGSKIENVVPCLVNLVSKSNGNLIEETIEIRNADGKQHWLQFEYVPSVNPVTGNLDGLIFANDVTESVKQRHALMNLNAQLAQDRELYADQYRRTPAMLHSIDSSGCIQEVSDFWLKRLGYSRDEVVGVKSVDFLTSASRELALNDYLPKFWKTGALVDEAVQFVAKNSEIVDVELSAVVDRMHEDDSDRTLAVLMDVTERNRVMEELELVNAELRQFNHLAAHDLQEPLRKVRYFSDMLQQAVSDANSEDIGYALGVIVNSAERASSLVSDLLAFSRVSNHELNLAPVLLSELVGLALEDLSLRIEESGAKVDVDLRDTTVVADSSLTRQIFHNLISNGLKYRSSDRRLVLKISDAMSDGSICVDVRDNGIGFDPIHTDRIFKPFNRLHGHSEISGTGIGLAVVTKIAQRQGWIVTAEGRPGEGAVFSVHIPNSIN